MVVPEHLIEAVNKVQDTILICAPVISQYAALGAVAAGRNYCLEKLAGIEHVRQIVLTSLAEIRQYCEIPPADGAFYFLLRLKTDQDALSVVEQLIRQYKVAVIPGNAFGLDGGCYVRVAYGSLAPDTAATALERLVAGLRSIL
jgi:aspartate/methionine/tyrosine aminotransferase